MPDPKDQQTQPANSPNPKDIPPKEPEPDEQPQPAPDEIEPGK